ncbi:MAG: efflux transporter periplasmic adaptor subunit [Bacteroidetes bacterium HGW-Bacteroidetes-4]|jgi:HlyD family secretion protein|nr:MAG: efflux transporter periplasmic adaptor subunit [Bacteroidetes bacterium HGW-Bacteroidetes-4]
MKKFFRILIWVIIAAAFLGTLAFLASKSKKKPVVYEIHKPTKIDIVKKTIATGSVLPRKEIQIKPQISGIVQEIYLEAGQMVKEGQVIARIKVIPDMISLNAAESRVKQAELNFENEKLKFERQQQLYKKNVISESEFQNAELAYNSANEELQTAKNNLDIIKEGVNRKAETATNTLIRSTISGMLLDIPVKEGNSVIQSNNFNDGTTIAIVADMTDMIFEGKVDETEVGKIVEGMPLKLTIGAIESERFDANLEYISPKGVEENGAIQFDIKAKVELKKNQFIRSGYSANAEIELERRDSVMAITEGLITFSADTAFVQVLTSDSITIPQTFDKRKIEIGLSDGINIEVTEGLSWDDLLKGEPKKEEKKKGPQAQS